MGGGGRLAEGRASGVARTRRACDRSRGEARRAASAGARAARRRDGVMTLRCAGVSCAPVARMSERVSLPVFRTGNLAIPPLRSVRRACVGFDAAQCVPGQTACVPGRLRVVRRRRARARQAGGGTPAFALVVPRVVSRETDRGITRAVPDQACARASRTSRAARSIRRTHDSRDRASDAAPRFSRAASTAGSRRRAPPNA